MGDRETKKWLKGDHAHTVGKRAKKVGVERLHTLKHPSPNDCAHSVVGLIIEWTFHNKFFIVQYLVGHLPSEYMSVPSHHCIHMIRGYPCHSGLSTHVQLDLLSGSGWTTGHSCHKSGLSCHPCFRSSLCGPPKFCLHSAMQSISSGTESIPETSDGGQ